jgi:menaquinone-dependent protoporphyrinogen oxidase
MSRHDKRVVDFVQQNRDLLDRLPSAFFSVSLAAHGDTEEAAGYVEQFELQTGWRPAKIALFSGALLYTHCGFTKRHMMKKIARDKPGHLGTDTSRDYVYTEWDGVKQFAEDFLADLAAEASGTTDWPVMPEIDRSRYPQRQRDPEPLACGRSGGRRGS